MFGHSKHSIFAITFFQERKKINKLKIRCRKRQPMSVCVCPCVFASYDASLNMNLCEETRGKKMSEMLQCTVCIAWKRRQLECACACVYLHILIVHEWTGVVYSLVAVAAAAWALTVTIVIAVVVMVVVVTLLCTFIRYTNQVFRWNCFFFHYKIYLLLVV